MEEITKQNSGKFILLKVNIDKCPMIAEHLNVSSIPVVYLCYKGSLMDNFIGIPSFESLQQFFNKALLVDAMATDETVM